jgi:hypothetical protein
MDFIYQDPYPILKTIPNIAKSSDYVKVEKLGDREILTIDPKDSNYFRKSIERCFVYVAYFAFRKVESHS